MKSSVSKVAALCVTLMLAVCVQLAHARGFIAPKTYATGKGPANPALVDVNNDGILDIVTANKTDSDISVLLGNGDGTFQTAIASGMIVGRTISGFTVGDVNGDGKTDVAVWVEDGLLFILLGDGTGHFNVLNSRGLLGIQPSFMLLADFNGDGKLDYAVTYFDVTRVGVALGNGDGTFQNEKLF